MIIQISMAISFVLLAIATMQMVTTRRRFRSSGARRRMRSAASRSKHRPYDDSLLSHPRVRKAIDEGRVLDAARHVRRISGMGAKQALRLVERERAH